MTADGWEAAGCLRRTKEDENGKSQATENDVRTPCTNIIMFCCLVVGCEHVKCKTSVRKLGRGEEKEVKKESKRS